MEVGEELEGARTLSSRFSADRHDPAAGKFTSPDEMAAREERWMGGSQQGGPAGEENPLLAALGQKG